MSDEFTAPFFLAGGALSVDAPSYIERDADQQLFAALLRGEFCYLLVSRQMGKSSLMVRTAVRLRRGGVSAVVLDLNTLGHDLTRDQWYFSLTLQMARKLNVLREIKAYCAQADDLSPLQKWIGAVQHILLHLHTGRLVVFVDEIDQVRLLPFNVDEFFAAIRSCYSRRPEDPEFDRLTFCLLGVALPSELIADHRMTPFNIGTRIELTDFTEEQTLGLMAGLRRDEILSTALMERIFRWTHGHPYLTQRLCRAIVETPDVFTAQHLDKLCRQLFLTKDAQQQDDNLIFVRDRLLKSDADIADLLSLYARMARRLPVRNEKANRLVDVLLLAGMVRVDEGSFVVRNRIYAFVFDQAWIREHLPHAEVRRQRAAFRRGVLRAGGIFAVFATIMGGMALFAYQLAHQAEQETKRVDLMAYASDMNVAQQAWEEGGVGQTLELLQAHMPKPGKDDLRDFEWRYLWTQCHRARAILPAHQGILFSVAVSPDGGLMASGGENGTIRLWDTATMKQVGKPLVGHTSYVLCVTFSSDGKILASASEDMTVCLWDVKRRKRIGVLTGCRKRICSAAFSPNNRMLAASSADSSARIWDVKTLKLMTTLRLKGEGNSVTFSPDGRMLAVGDGDKFRSYRVRLWIVGTWRQVGHDLPVSDSVYSLVFSHNGRMLAAGNHDGTTNLWGVEAQRPIKVFREHTDLINSIIFSGDDRTLVTASWDNTIKLWNVLSLKLISTLKGHTDRVTATAFLRNETRLASCSSDGTIRLWDMAAVRTVPFWKATSHNELLPIAWSPDSRMLAVGGGDGSITLWDVAAQQLRGILAGDPGQPTEIASIAFSPDGKALACSQDKKVRVWDIASMRVTKAFIGQKDIGPVAWSSKGDLLAAVEQGGHQLRLWNTTTWHEVGTPFLISEKPIFSIAFAPNGNELAVAESLSNQIVLWDIASHKQIGVLVGHTGTIYSLSFSTDGATLASCSFDRMIRLWNVPALQPIAVFKGHRGLIDSVVFSPDGKTLASGSSDKTVRLWSVETGHKLGRGLEVATLHGHLGKVHSVAFSPDGNTLASADKDGNIRLWRADPVKDDTVRKEFAVLLPKPQAH